MVNTTVQHAVFCLGINGIGVATQDGAVVVALAGVGLDAPSRRRFTVTDDLGTLRIERSFDSGAAVQSPGGRAERKQNRGNDQAEKISHAAPKIATITNSPIDTPCLSTHTDA